MSAFDPQAFLQEEVTEPFETKFTPVPEDDYTAVIGTSEKSVAVRTTDKGQVLADLQWEILDEAVKQALSMDTVIVRQSIFLDVTDQGKLDFGKNKNIQLGRLREALGQNTTGPWSLTRLRGAGPAIITVKQRVDPTDPEKIYSEVKYVNSPQAAQKRTKTKAA